MLASTKTVPAAGYGCGETSPGKSTFGCPKADGSGFWNRASCGLTSERGTLRHLDARASRSELAAPDEALLPHSFPDRCLLAMMLAVLFLDRKQKEEIRLDRSQPLAHAGLI